MGWGVNHPIFMKAKLQKRIKKLQDDMVLIELEARRLRAQADELRLKADQYDIELSFRHNMIKELEELLNE